MLHDAATAAAAVAASSHARDEGAGVAARARRGTVAEAQEAAAAAVAASETSYALQGRPLLEVRRVQPLLVAVGAVAGRRREDADAPVADAHGALPWRRLALVEVVDKRALPPAAASDRRALSTPAMRAQTQLGGGKRVAIDGALRQVEKIVVHGAEERAATAGGPAGGAAGGSKAARGHGHSESDGEGEGEAGADVSGPRPGVLPPPLLPPAEPAGGGATATEREELAAAKLQAFFRGALLRLKGIVWDASFAPVPAGRKLGLELGGATGLVVNKVFAGGTAQQLGLEEGSVILAVNRSRVRNGMELAMLVRGAPKRDALVLRVQRPAAEHKLQLEGALLKLSLPKAPTAAPVGEGVASAVEPELIDAVTFGGTWKEKRASVNVVGELCCRSVRRGKEEVLVLAGCHVRLTSDAFRAALAAGKKGGKGKKGGAAAVDPALTFAVVPGADAHAAGARPMVLAARDGDQLDDWMDTLRRHVREAKSAAEEAELSGAAATLPPSSGGAAAVASPPSSAPAPSSAAPGAAEKGGLAAAPPLDEEAECAAARRGGGARGARGGGARGSA